MTPSFPYDEWSEFKRDGRAPEAVRGADDELAVQAAQEWLATGNANAYGIDCMARALPRALASHRALVELVACKRIKDRIDEIERGLECNIADSEHRDEWQRLWTEYHRLKPPLAWSTAFAAAAPTPPPIVVWGVGAGVVPAAPLQAKPELDSRQMMEQWRTNHEAAPAPPQAKPAEPRFTREQIERWAAMDAAFSSDTCGKCNTKLAPRVRHYLACDCGMSQEAVAAAPAGDALMEAQIVAIRDEHLPSQGDPFDCIAFARAVLAALAQTHAEGK